MECRSIHFIQCSPGAEWQQTVTYFRFSTCLESTPTLHRILTPMTLPATLRLKYYVLIKPLFRIAATR